MKNEATIYVGGNRYLVCRKNELGRAIHLVDKTENGYSETVAIVATTPIGCAALADALADMAELLR